MIIKLQLVLRITRLKFVYFRQSSLNCNINKGHTLSCDMLKFYATRVAISRYNLANRKFAIIVLQNAKK